jgi:hypothetical protein
MWLDHYTDDFNEPPDYPLLCSLQSFAKQCMHESDLHVRCRNKVALFQKAHEFSTIISGKSCSAYVHLCIAAFTWLCCTITVIAGRTAVGCVLIYSACHSVSLFIYSSPFFGSRFSQKRLGLRTPNLVGMFLRTIRRYDVNFKGVAQGVWGQTSKMDPI